MRNEFERVAGHYDRAAFLRRGAALGAAFGLAGGLSRHAFARVEGATLNLVAYSTPKPVMTQLETAFAQTAQGSGVSFAQSFGPSTSQAQAVVAGQPADIVFFSWPGDMQLLVNAGLVSATWDEQSYHGIVANTVVVFALRDGNPKHITQWSDLIKKGVQVITPDPFSSGSAKWNILAAYAAQRHLGKSDAQAIAYVKALVKNVVAQPTSGTNATAAFLAGEGDVLLTYESEALAASHAGSSIQYVIPKQTMLIQLPIAVLEKSPNLALANDFVRFIKQTPQQLTFGQYGFRPVNPAAAAKFAFPVRPGQITLDDPVLGGLAKVQARWFASGGLMSRIEQSVGGPTA